MRSKKDKFTRRLLTVLVALILLGLGVGFYLYADLGADTGSTLAMGISHALGIEFGHANALANIILLIPVFFIDRSYIHVTTIMALFIIGYVAQGVETLLTLVMMPLPPLWLRYIFLLVAILVIGFSVPFYVRPGLGVGGLDLPPELVSDKLKWPYRYVRIAFDLAYVTIGILLGATYGIGTILTVLLLGPTVSLFRKRANALADWMIG